MKLKPLLLFTLGLLLASMAQAQTPVPVPVTDDGITTPATGYVPVFNGVVGSSPATAYTVTNSQLYQDATNRIGIGTTTPNSLLHIVKPHQMGSFPPPDYDCFSITQVMSLSYPDLIPDIRTHFIVNADGNVGIGIADPTVPLQVRGDNWSDGTKDMGEPITLFTDPDENILGGFFNVGGNTNSDDLGGAFGIATRTSSGLISFAVFNMLNEKIPFGVLDNGTVGMGLDMNTFTPEAQVNIAQSNSYDYLLKMQNADQSVDYFTVHNDGFVGIGAENAGTSLLEINDANITSPSSLGSLLYIHNADNTDGVPEIMVDNGTYSAGSVYFILRKNSLGIGQDPLSISSTFALKGTGNTKLDLFETSSTVDHNAQIRFVGSDGTTIRHLITENADGGLLIDAGYSTAANKVKVDGELETTSNVVVNGTLTVMNGTDKEFKVYADGKVRAREVQVDLANIPDYVFNEDYKLSTIEELNNYVTTNKHLPNVPSQSDYTATGSINLGELNLKLLEKVEELSLYIIQLNNRVKSLENEK